MEDFTGLVGKRIKYTDGSIGEWRKAKGYCDANKGVGIGGRECFKCDCFKGYSEKEVAIEKYEYIISCRRKPE